MSGKNKGCLEIAVNFFHFLKNIVACLMVKICSRHAGQDNFRLSPGDAENHYVPELMGVDKSATYYKVLYWVRESNFWPYRAEFYSLSNRLLKTARYENFRKMLGAQRPTRLVTEDALRQGEKSVLEYSEMKLRDLEDKIFTKDYLKKLQ
jgi:hypothetical protein